MLHTRFSFIRSLKLATSMVVILLCSMVAGQASQAIGQYFVDSFKVMGAKSSGAETIIWSEHNDIVVISRLKIEGLDEDENNITIAKVIIHSPRKSSDGGFTAVQLDLERLLVVNTEVKLRIASVASFDVNYPGPGSLEVTRGTEQFTGQYSKVNFQNVGLDLEELAAGITIDGGSIVNRNFHEGLPHNTRLEISNLHLPIQLFENNPAGLMLKTLGYEALNIDIESQSNFKLQDRIFSVDAVSVDIKNFGRFIVGIKIGGISFSDLMSGDDRKMQTLLGTATLVNAGITFEDSSITNRLIKYFANQNGISTQSYRTKIENQTHTGLSALRNPEFQNRATVEIATFLNNPESIGFTIQPDAPIAPFAIAGMAFSAPGQLIDLLKLRIFANK
ncbi:MAG: hypothetical protein JKY49_12265 [Cohaesibacteraceae bacterium]|nr:hypothetical protein [Cohaesibacteraceae bacterium]MBL4875790.1 hypothetical protein [Cohaesibacteraceae bacterium]